MVLAEIENRFQYESVGGVLSTETVIYFRSIQSGESAPQMSSAASSGMVSS